VKKFNNKKKKYKLKLSESGFGIEKNFNYYTKNNLLKI